MALFRVVVTRAGDTVRAGSSANLGAGPEREAAELTRGGRLPIAGGGRAPAPKGLASWRLRGEEPTPGVGALEKVRPPLLLSRLLNDGVLPIDALVEANRRTSVGDM